jgi:hypothetical protein
VLLELLRKLAVLLNIPEFVHESNINNTPMKELEKSVATILGLNPLKWARKVQRDYKSK